MGRVIVHLHGSPSNAKMSGLIEDYSSRVKSKVKIEVHHSKLSADDYLAKLPNGAILLDEGGEHMTSLEFSRRHENWVIYLQMMFTLQLDQQMVFQKGMVNKQSLYRR